MHWILMAKAAAVKYPQALYGAFTKLLQSERTFLQRVVPGCDDACSAVKVEMECSLIPQIFGREILEKEFELFELPVKFGGMDLRNPVRTASLSFEDSLKATAMIQYSIEKGTNLDIFEHNENVKKKLENSKNLRNVYYKIQSETIANEFSTDQKRVIQRVIEGNVSV
mmetsp:Transcript_17038/g.22160  ORF Transcript_17038/g.22160 Transcript_17038/m.22160 type:complete len:168 (-) Transcript_17038:232-735(-)